MTGAEGIEFCRELPGVKKKGNKAFAGKGLLEGPPKVIPQPAVLRGVKAEFASPPADFFRDNPLHGLPQDIFGPPVSDLETKREPGQEFYQTKIQERSPAFDGKSHGIFVFITKERGKAESVHVEQNSSGKRTVPAYGDWYFFRKQDFRADDVGEALPMPTKPEITQTVPNLYPGEKGKVAEGKEAFLKKCCACFA